MANNKHFLQDRTALLLVSVLSFMVLAATVLILLKLNAAHGTVNYIISYRATLGLDRYATGSAADILSFIGAAVLIYVISIVLALRVYKIRRELSLVVLSLTVPLLAFLIVVSNALLTLR